MIGIVRTLSPMIAGYIVSLLAEWGLDLSGKPTTAQTIAVVAGIVWYLVARWLERKWPSIGGLMLGSSQQPTYQAIETGKHRIASGPGTTVPVTAANEKGKPGA